MPIGVYKRTPDMKIGKNPNSRNGFKKKTHCPKGHSYTQENTYVNPSGSKNCKICRKKWIRDYFKNFPNRRKVLKKVQWAVKCKKLNRPTKCEICNNKAKIQGHHKDYSKPLEVIWVCAFCHAKIHKRMRKI